MFRKLDVTNKSIICGSNAGLTNKFGIPALASKLVIMLSSLISGIGAVFYMILSFILNQTKKQISSSISTPQTTNFDNYCPDTYIQRVVGSAPVAVNTNAPVEQEMFSNQNINQLKFVKQGLFFCALTSERQDLAQQRPEKAKIVELSGKQKQKINLSSSTDKRMSKIPDLFPIRINQTNKMNKPEPAFSEMLNAR